MVQFAKENVLSRELARRSGTHLEISSLLKNGDDGLIYIRYQFVPFRFPQIIHTQLELLHQCVL